MLYSYFYLEFALFMHNIDIWEEIIKPNDFCYGFDSNQ